MFCEKFLRLKLGFALLLLLPLVSAWSCSKSAAPGLSKDVLGVVVGMSRDEVRAHLGGAQLERSEGKRQEVWAFPNDERFGRAAIGFDAEDKVRFITAFARKKRENGAAAAASQVRYADFGDLAAAKQNVFMAQGSVEYVWEIAARDGKPAYFIIARGFDPIFAETVSLMKSGGKNEADEDEDKE